MPLMKSEKKMVQALMLVVGIAAFIFGWSSKTPATGGSAFPPPPDGHAWSYRGERYEAPAKLTMVAGAALAVAGLLVRRDNP